MVVLVVSSPVLGGVGYLELAVYHEVEPQDVKEPQLVQELPSHTLKASLHNGLHFELRGRWWGVVVHVKGSGSACGGGNTQACL